MTSNNIIPVYYRISIDPTLLNNVGSGPYTPIGSFTSDELNQPGAFNNLNFGFIENQKVSDYLRQGFDYSQDFAFSIIKERSVLRYEKIIQYLQENANVQYQLEFSVDYGFNPDPNGGPSLNPNRFEPTSGPFEFTVGYYREEYIYTKNTEKLAGISSPASTDIFFNEEAINRQVARALTTTWSIARLVFDPTLTTGQGPLGVNFAFRDLRKNMPVTAERLSTTIPNAQSAITVTKIILT